MLASVTQRLRPAERRESSHISELSEKKKRVRGNIYCVLQWPVTF